ncbi:MAG: hypothetical protein KJZ78_20110 [Bryobacteraceae bacterium]|nr:hypothetical protein [Bryobacteraceae bacterium]
MARRNPKRDRIAEAIRESGWERIGVEEFARLQAAFVPVSARYLREAIRASGVPMSPLAEGIRQDSLEELERTLLRMQTEYQAANQAGDARRARQCRAAVIKSKDHAKWALKKAVQEEKRRERAEMILWMLTWLENPALFPDWLKLRKRKVRRETVPPLRISY